MPKGLVVLIALVWGLSGCIGPADAAYQLTVVNKDPVPVVVYVNGVRRGISGEMVNPCSTHAFDASVVGPGSALDIRVVDARGGTVLATKVTPEYRQGLATVKVTVPGSCSDAGPE